MIPVPVEVPNIVSMPIVIESMLRIEGLHDVFSPYLPLACPSVFSRTKGWSKGLLRRRSCGFSTLYNKKMPTSTLLAMPAVPTVLLYTLSPLQVTPIFRKWWEFEMGVWNGGLKWGLIKCSMRCSMSNSQLRVSWKLQLRATINNWTDYWTYYWEQYKCRSQQQLQC